MMTFIPFEKRLTMEQLAAIGGAAGPAGCPRCGCKDWRVISGEDGKRKRVCRHCRRVLGSYKPPALNAAESPPPIDDLPELPGLAPPT